MHFVIILQDFWQCIPKSLPPAFRLRFGIGQIIAVQRRVADTVFCYRGWAICLLRSGGSMIQALCFVCPPKIVQDFVSRDQIVTLKFGRAGPALLSATRTNNWSVKQRLTGHPEEFLLFFLLRRQDEHVTSNNQPNPDTTKRKHDPTVQNKGVFFFPPIQIRTTNFVQSVPNKTSTNKWKGYKGSPTRTTTHSPSKK